MPVGTLNLPCEGPPLECVAWTSTAAALHCLLDAYNNCLRNDICVVPGSGVLRHQTAANASGPGGSDSSGRGKSRACTNRSGLTAEDAAVGLEGGVS